MSRSPQPFRVEDVVWAKLGDYRTWPCEILSLDGRQQNTLDETSGHAVVRPLLPNPLPHLSLFTRFVWLSEEHQVSYSNIYEWTPSLTRLFVNTHSHKELNFALREAEKLRQSRGQISQQTSKRKSLGEAEPSQELKGAVGTTTAAATASPSAAPLSSQAAQVTVGVGATTTLPTYFPVADNTDHEEGEEYSEEEEEDEGGEEEEEEEEEGDEEEEEEDEGGEEEEEEEEEGDEEEEEEDEGGEEEEEEEEGDEEEEEEDEEVEEGGDGRRLGYSVRESTSRQQLQQSTSGGDRGEIGNRRGHARPGGSSVPGSNYCAGRLSAELRGSSSQERTEKPGSASAASSLSGSVASSLSSSWNVPAKLAMLRHQQQQGAEGDGGGGRRETGRGSKGRGGGEQ
ncbi:unnamed protein product [Closterium sp. Yama58-4]|nr:unnamed protein product [Closterium sp. Yama58-4]